MAITDYDSLKTAVADFLNRDDLTASVGTFISLAEAQIARDVRHWRMEKRASAPITDRYTALPDDFVEPTSLYIDGVNRALIPITQNEMQGKRYSSADITDTPRFYAITAGEIELFPTPSSGTLNMYYVGTLPVLSDANTTNWLLDEAQDVYLYGALLQTAPYLSDDERMATWATLYSAATSNLNARSEEAKWGGQGLRMTMRAS